MGFLEWLGVLALVLLLALGVGLWWLKRWWKRMISRAARVQRDMDPRLAWPARLVLAGHRIDPEEDPFALQWPNWVTAGFSRLGDYRCSEGGLDSLRLAAHPGGMTLCLALDPVLKPCATLYGVTEDGRFVAVSEAPGAASTAKLRWIPADTGEPTALSSMLEAALAETGQSLRTLDARVAAVAFERGYAVWRDQQLAQPPTLESIQARLAAGGTPVDPATLRAALDANFHRWRELLSAAALDHWRQSTKPEAETWARLQHEIEVIPEAISDDDVQALLGGDELADQLLAQTTAQGLTGIRRYAAVVERLHLDQRRHELARLGRPVPLRLYVRDAAQPPAQAAPETRTYVYRRAEGGDGGVVLGSSVADARAQLRSMGLADADILIEPNALSSGSDRQFWTPEAATEAARGASDSIGRALLRALLGNLWLWLPPLLALAWAFHGADGVGIWQIVAVGYALLSIGALLWLVLPMVLYNQVLEHKASARYAGAKNLMTVLRLIRPLGMTAAQIQRELASIEFAMGRSDAALQRLQGLRPTLDEAGWYEILAASLGSSGDHDALIDAQRRAAELAQDPTLLRIDLAMSLLRYRRDAAGADTLLGSVAPGSLSTTSAAGYHYARGLLLAERAQHAAALRQYRSAIDSLATFKSNPLVRVLTSEMEAFAALSLRAEGRREEASAVWAAVWPQLSRHPSTRYLAARWAASEAGSADSGRPAAA